VPGKVDVISVYAARSACFVHHFQAARRHPPAALLKIKRRFRLRAVSRALNIYARDEHESSTCGDGFPTQQLTFESRRAGPPMAAVGWENIGTCCVTCNRRTCGRTRPKPAWHLSDIQAPPIRLRRPHHRTVSGTRLKAAGLSLRERRARRTNVRRSSPPFSACAIEGWRHHHRGTGFSCLRSVTPRRFEWWRLTPRLVLRFADGARRDRDPPASSAAARPVRVAGVSDETWWSGRHRRAAGPGCSVDNPFSISTTTVRTFSGTRDAGAGVVFRVRRTARAIRFPSGIVTPTSMAMDQTLKCIG